MRKKGELTVPNTEEQKEKMPEKNGPARHSGEYAQTEDAGKEPDAASDGINRGQTAGKKKFVFNKRALMLAIIFGMLATTFLVLWAGYYEAVLPVLMLWIIAPIFFAWIVSKVRKK